MVQVLAVEVMEVVILLFTLTIKSIRVYRTSIVRLFNPLCRCLSRLFPYYKIYNRLLELIVLLEILISAFGEIWGSADGADGARPPLSSTHYGLQRRCGAEVEKRSAVFGSPAELASPIRLGYVSARRPDKAVRPAQLRGKRYGRLCQLLSPEGPLSNRHRLPSGSSP